MLRRDFLRTLAILLSFLVFPWAKPAKAKRPTRDDAVDAINAFTRAKLREDHGFFRRIMPPMAISNDELDRQVDDEPVLYKTGRQVGKSTSASFGGIPIPFKTLPTNVYIKGPRYMVVFDRYYPISKNELDEYGTQRIPG